MSPPATYAGIVSTRLPARPAEVGRGRPAEGQAPRWRILVVDDDESVALALQEILAGLPHCQTEIALDAQEALQRVAQHPFDLLITDYKMPGLDGLTLAARVRQLYPQMPVILLTAYGSEVVHEQAGRVPVQHILDKPIGLMAIREAALDALRTPGELEEGSRG